MHTVSITQEAEAIERHDFLLGLQQYATQFQRGITILLQVAQESNVRSDVRLSDIASLLATDTEMAVDMDPTKDYGAAQEDGSLDQGYHAKKENSDSPALDDQPKAVEGNSPTQDAQYPYHVICVVYIYCS